MPGFDQSRDLLRPIAGMAVTAMQAGFPVLCEKPLAPDRSGAHTMLDTAMATGQLLMMASKFRYVADVALAKQLIESGELGEIVLFRNAFTSVVPRNDYATLKVNVRPRGRCTITVVYSTGPSSAAGLRAKIGGLITWRWKVGSNTKLGRWPVTVDCSNSGSRRFTLRVVR